MKMVTNVSLRQAHVHQWSLKGAGQIQGFDAISSLYKQLTEIWHTMERKRDWPDLYEVTFISSLALHYATLLVLH